jgi:chromosome segregation ATPase
MDVQKLFIDEQRGINLISNKKYLEEISQLNRELIKTRREYSSRVIELELKIKLLNSELAETHKNLNEKIAELEKINFNKKQKTTNAGNIKKLEEKLREKDKYIEQLHARECELMAEKHQLYNIVDGIGKNKAGRKSKATEENVAEIIRLRNEGYSYGGIAKIITESSGEYICKSTVANIIKGKKCP